MALKTYGAIEYDFVNSRFTITHADAHVCIKLKQIFPKIKKTAVAPFHFQDTPEICSDLEWFIQRYPLIISNADAEILRLGKNEYERDINETEMIHHPDYVPREVMLMGGYQAREYQVRASETYLKVKRMLLGDDLGLGKTLSGILSLLDQRTLPAVIVVQTHMANQWKEDGIEKFTNLTAHIVKGTKPYSLPPADVYIFKYSCLSGWINAFDEAPFKSVIFDECQEFRRSASEKYAGGLRLSQSVDFALGLSVGPNSNIELRGGVFGRGWIGKIEDATNVVENSFVSFKDGSHLIFNTEESGIESRGWDDDLGFCWKPVKKFIKHPLDKKIISVKVRGKNLIVTEDHSVFTINDQEELICLPSSKLSISDTIPSDNGSNWGEGEVPFNMIETFASTKRLQVIVDYRHLGRECLGISRESWNNYRHEGPFGTRLPAKEYLRLKDLLPEPKLVYLQANSNRDNPTSAIFNLSNLAYVIGFWIGNGWVEKGDFRVGFSVKTSVFEKFKNELSNISDFRFEHIEEKKQRGEFCKEIRVGNSLFAALFKHLFGDVKAPTKFIPSEFITTWTKEAKFRLIEGLMDSDGHLGKRKARAYYSTTSEKLANDLCSLLRSVGIHPSMSKKPAGEGGFVDGKKIIGTFDSYCINWSIFSNSGHYGPIHKFKSFENRIFESTIRDICEVNESFKWVYDLEMSGHPSFVCDGFLVHNSATPVYNMGDEIYNVMNLIYPECLGTRDEFIREWCVSYGQGYKVTDPKALGSYLRERFLVLRRTRTEVGRELPIINKIVHTVDYDHEAVRTFEELAKQLAMKVSQGTFLERGEAARELDMLARLNTGISKARYVAAYVRILLENGEPVILAGWHRAVYDIWMEELKEFNPVMYTGSESPSKKEEAKRAFMAGETLLFIISLRSGAGLDGLQHICNNVVVGEMDWSPQVHNQLIGRVDRDGQLVQVTAHFLVSEYGSDPVIVNVLGLKAAQSQGIVDPLTEPAQQHSDESRMKQLAASFLERKKHSHQD